MNVTYTLADKLFDPLSLMEDNGTSDNRFTKDDYSQWTYLALSIICGVFTVGLAHLIYYAAIQFTAQKIQPTHVAINCYEYPQGYLQDEKEYVKEFLRQQFGKIIVFHEGKVIPNMARIFVEFSSYRSKNIFSESVPKRQKYCVEKDEYSPENIIYLALTSHEDQELEQYEHLKEINQKAILHFSTIPGINRECKGNTDEISRLNSENIDKLTLFLTPKICIPFEE